MHFPERKLKSRCLFGRHHLGFWVWYTGCNRRNGPDFGRVFLMLNYTEKPPKHLYPKFNGYGDIGQRKEWTTLVSAYCTMYVTSYSAYLGDGPRLFQLHSYVIARYSWATLAVSAVYSGWKSVDNYDTCASVFVVLFNGFIHSQVTLMLCTDINITETTYSCQFQYVFGNQLRE